MQEMLDFARGPLFRFSLAVLILGMGRIAVLTIWGMVKALKNTRDKNVPYRKLIMETLGWIVPVRHIIRSRSAFIVVSFVFHVGLIIVPIFLLDHILLWQKGLGISWPAIAKGVADILAIITLAGGIVLLGWRILNRNAKSLSGVLDYSLLLLIILLFSSGLIASRPYNPVPYTTTMLVHVLCGNAILFLVPFSKLAHCFLYPLLRIASNIAWRFPASAGEKINMALYGEEIRKI